MLGNTHWVETSRIFYIIPTLTQKVTFHIGRLQFSRKNYFHLLHPNQKKIGFFPLLLTSSPQRTGWNEITGSGSGLGKITDDQIWMFKCVIVVLMQEKLLLKCLFHGYFKGIYV